MEMPARNIDGAARAKRLDIFVDEFKFDVFGQGGGEDHRAVRREMEFGLAAQLGPLRNR